ncbi:hypothetical protein [Brachybacterium sp. Marseille-Q7125]|uniref:hypothetical protein n=1 Tax=Brachybacterium sp. Marseille-Q7125 TaxID=2932815 RepID=UPI001FF26307|nr:hypothetical protein [Brachybacterium sp. Marseille-Q7125]
MSSLRSFPTHLPRPTPFSGQEAAHQERESIRALLLERRPSLARRLSVGPSGALVIPLPGGGSVEVGRMRRRGAARWVVVAPTADAPGGVKVREPHTLGGITRAVLTALDSTDMR